MTSHTATTGPPGVLLNTSDVARRLGVSVDHVLGLIASRRLKAADASLGKRRPRWRINPDDLNLFLAGQTTALKPPARRKQRTAGVIEFFK